MNNKVYNALKFIAQIVLPALATFYISLAELWGLPLSKEISGTIMAIDTLLGALLMLSSNSYYKKMSDSELSDGKGE